MKPTIFAVVTILGFSMAPAFADSAIEQMRSGSCDVIVDILSSRYSAENGAWLEMESDRYLHAKAATDAMNGLLKKLSPEVKETAKLIRYARANGKEQLAKDLSQRLQVQVGSELRGEIGKHALSSERYCYTGWKMQKDSNTCTRQYEIYNQWKSNELKTESEPAHVVDTLFFDIGFSRSHPNQLVLTLGKQNSPNSGLGRNYDYSYFVASAKVDLLNLKTVSPKDFVGNDEKKSYLGKRDLTRTEAIQRDKELPPACKSSAKIRNLARQEMESLNALKIKVDPAVYGQELKARQAAFGSSAR